MSVLKKPLISEKATKFSDKGVYGFIVDIDANRLEIKKEVENIYGVVVTRTNTMRCSGKKKLSRTKRGSRVGYKSMYKKAFVKLKDGDIIDFYNITD